MYCSAPLGAGKTHGICKKAIELATLTDRKVIIAQPTTRLVEQTFVSELGNFSTGVPITRIHSQQPEFHGQKVSKRIISHLSNTEPGGEVVLVTHEALLRLPVHVFKSPWHLFVDEIPAPDNPHNIQLPDTHRLITDHVRPVPFSVEMTELQIGNYTEVVRIASNRQKDRLLEQLSDLANDILNPHRVTIAKTEHFYGLLNGNERHRKLIASSFLMPSSLRAFASVTLCGANFEDTLLHKLWSRKGVEFVPVPMDLRYDKHDGSNVTIYHLGLPTWSKKRGEVLSEGTPTLAKVVDVIKGFRPDGGFAWMANESVANTTFSDIPGVSRLPSVSKGLNTFQSFNTVVCLGAYHPAPAAFGHWAAMGVSRDEVKTAVHREVIYQASGRGGTRIPNNPEPQAIVVVDKPTAEWLSEKYAGSKLCLIDGIEVKPQKRAGRPAVHENAAAKQREYRRNKREAKNPNTTERYESTIRISNNVTALATLFNDLYGNAIQTLSCSDFGEFAAFLKEMSHRKIGRKEDAGVFSPAIFDEAGKKRANVLFSNIVVLDNDGGGIGPDEFAAKFPTLEMVICSTFSSTPERLRWRCVIPLSRPVQSGEYIRITGRLFDLLRDVEHGFDMTKRQPENMFFLPSSPSCDIGRFVFHECQGCRAALKVDLWIADAPDNSAPIRLADPVTPTDEHGVSAAIFAWRAGRHIPGQGNALIYKLGVQLRKAGLPDDEAYELAVGEAEEANHPEERVRDVRRFFGRQ